MSLQHFHGGQHFMDSGGRIQYTILSSLHQILGKTSKPRHLLSSPKERQQVVWALLRTVGQAAPVVATHWQYLKSQPLQVSGKSCDGYWWLQWFIWWWTTARSLTCGCSHSESDLSITTTCATTLQAPSPFQVSHAFTGMGTITCSILVPWWCTMHHHWKIKASQPGRQEHYLPQLWWWGWTSASLHNWMPFPPSTSWSKSGNPPYSLGVEQQPIWLGFITWSGSALLHQLINRLWALLSWSHGSQVSVNTVDIRWRVTWLVIQCCLLIIIQAPVQVTSR